MDCRVEPTVIEAAEDRSDPDSIALVGEYNGNCWIIYENPNFNRTPAQAQKLFRLKKEIGSAVDFRDSEGILRASVRGDSVGDVLLAYYSPQERELWTLNVGASDTVPDPAALVVRPLFSYRLLAPALLLFLFVMVCCFLIIDSFQGAVAAILLAFVIILSVCILMIIRNLICK